MVAKKNKPIMVQMCSRSKQNLPSGGNGMISEFGPYFYITFSSPLPSFPQIHSFPLLSSLHSFLTDFFLLVPADRFNF
jgi:hypothetical protein